MWPTVSQPSDFMIGDDKAHWQLGCHASHSVRPRSLYLLDSGVEIYCASLVRDEKGTTKNLCDNKFAKLSGEISGAICLKTHVLLNTEYCSKTVRKMFGSVRVNLWLCGSCFRRRRNDNNSLRQ